MALTLHMLLLHDAVTHRQVRKILLLDVFVTTSALIQRCWCFRFLKRTIQSGSHDSIDDARAAMELAQLKIRNGPEYGTVQGRAQQGEPLTLMLSRHKCRSCFVDRQSIVHRYVKGDSSGINVDTDIQAVSFPHCACFPCTAARVHGS